MKICVFWFFILLCVVNLKYADCYKCEFRVSWGDYNCNIKSDSSSIEEKHLQGKTDDDVKEIFFSGTENGISNLTQTELTPFCQRFKNLYRIDIDDIKSVDEDLFQQCRNVKQIWITNSEIEEIPKKLFYEQPQLTQIDLKGNKLRKLPENVFTNKKELEYLYLGHNQISCLPSNIFKSLKKLGLLNLRKNKIQSLNPKWFENLQSLHWLDLSDNKIQDLPKNIFARLENLEVLILSGNQLTTIHSDSFGIHRSLWIIKLQNNKINAIDEKLFDNRVELPFNMKGNVCSNENIKDENEIKQKLSKCFDNYQPRKNQINLKCGTRNLVQQAMIGGNRIIKNEYPWNVALVRNTNDLFCSGTLVSNRHVVTAAHCMKGKEDGHVFGTGDFSVLLGVHNYSKPQEEGRISSCVSSITIHPDWNTDVQIFDADIAVLELANEVQFNNFIRPICLANEDSEIAQAHSGTVVGFGKTETEFLSDIANKLEVPIRKYHNCTKHSEDHRDLVSARTFCGGPADGRTVCSGDSGGGVYVKHNGQFYLRGLVSATLLDNNKQCNVFKQAIFTEVTKSHDWIKQVESSRN